MDEDFWKNKIKAQLNDVKLDDLEKVSNYIQEFVDGNYITHIFDTSKRYIVNVQINGGYTFYKIPLKKEDFDGQTKNGFINVRFAKNHCEPVPDGTIIKIKNAAEYWYTKGFNTIVTLVIFNYEIVQESDAAAKQAIQEFNQTDTNDDELPF